MWTNHSYCSLAHAWSIEPRKSKWLKANIAEGSGIPSSSQFINHETLPLHIMSHLVSCVIRWPSLKKLNKWRTISCQVPGSATTSKKYIWAITFFQVVRPNLHPFGKTDHRSCITLPGYLVFKPKCSFMLIPKFMKNSSFIFINIYGQKKLG